MSRGRDLGASRTYKASTSKQVLSRISRELGPDAVIVTHRKTRDSDGRLWVEAAASPGPQGVFPAGSLLASEESPRKFGSRALLFSVLGVVFLVVAGGLIWRLLPRNKAADLLSGKLSIAVIGFENQTGDHSYDYLSKVIPNLLITSLEQSGIFDVAS